MENVTLRKAVELAITTEQLGAQYYRDLAKQFATEDRVASVFETLAADEVAHETEFGFLLDSLKTGTKTVGNPESYYLLRAAAMSEFFDKAALRDTSRIKTAADALRHAVDFEKSTLMFYLGLQEVLGASPQLSQLIDAEKGHIRSLMCALMEEVPEFRESVHLV